MRTIALLACSMSAFASQSLSVTTSVHASATIPNSAPFTQCSAGSCTMEFGLSAWTIPTSGCITVYAPISGSIYGGICSDGMLYMRDTLDTFPGNFYISMPLAGRTAIRARLQRRATNANQADCPCLLGEMWNDDGTGYASGYTPITTINPITLPATEFVGDGAAIFTITFARLIVGEVPTNKYILATQPPQDFTQAGSALEYLFSGTGNDSSGNGINLSITGTPSFPSIPPAAPVCLLTQQSFPSSAAAAINVSLSYPRDGGTTLTHSVTVVGGTWTPTIINPTSANPTFIVTQSGSVNLQDSITDSTGGAGHSSSCTIHDGTTIPAAPGIPKLPDPDGRGSFEKILGDVIQWNQNKWPWFDDRNIYLGNFFGAQVLTNTNTWTVPLVGTVSLTGGSATVTGVGTAFLSTYACNGTDYFVGYYPHTPPGGVSSTHYGQIAVASCASDTQLTLGVIWPTGIGSIGTAQYGKISAAQEGYWAANSSSVQFYDGVLAYLATNVRTGFDTFLNYANMLADQWFTWPSINKGQLCDGSGTTAPQCPFPRNMSFSGVILRALLVGDTSSSSNWPGLREMANNLYTLLSAGYETYPGPAPSYTVAPFMSDIREWSYAWTWIAEMAIADPDPTQRAHFAAMLTTNSTFPKLVPVTLLTNTQQSDKSWLNWSQVEHSTWQGDLTGTVTVQQGSTAVAGSGTNFVHLVPGGGGLKFCDTGSQLYLWTTTPATATTNPPDNTNGDPAALPVASVGSDTSMTLLAPYPYGTPSQVFTLRGYQCANQLSANGAQPFMQGGIMARFFSQAYWALVGIGDLTNANKYKQFAEDIWTGYMHNVGIQFTQNTFVTANAIYYGTGFTNCGSPPNIRPCNDLVTNFVAPAVPSITTNTVQNARFLDTETMGACARSYQFSGSTTTLADCNKLYGALYGGFGGPNADQYYIGGFMGTYAYEGDDVLLSKNKDFNFVFGWGAGAGWPAASFAPPVVGASVLGSHQVTGASQVLH